MTVATKQNLIYALDIGTRSVVGVVGVAQEDRFQVLDVELAEHNKRAMVDGQIDNIQQVAAVAKTVTQRLEERLGVSLKRVCVAAAGRALRTERGTFSLELPESGRIDAEQIGRLEAGAVSVAEEALQTSDETRQKFFLVGYTVSQYRLDGYPLTALLDHTGKVAEVDIIATFLPGEVVESLYAAMRAAGLQVSSLTLEPIAAMNAAIPAELRMLNLALVDIGAGTTDIAICKDGSVVGYTMATVAGDEITEAIMRAYLVDFQTAERIKREWKPGETATFIDILGLEQTITGEEIYASIETPMTRLAEAISEQILSVNNTAPSAIFLAGGGSRLEGLREKVARSLNVEERRVAIAGSNFAKSAYSDTIRLENPEYTTPLGIAVSAGMGLLNDSYIVLLNGEPAKLFRSGTLTLRDVLLMNGYSYADMLGGTGKTMSVTVDGRQVTLRGEPSVPAVLRLNDEEAAINMPIHAGDQIQFIPARKGADARKTLGELLGPDFRGQVLLNNEVCPMETELKQGDNILTLSVDAPRKVNVPVQKPEPPVQVQPEPQAAAPVAEPVAAPEAPQSTQTVVWPPQAATPVAEPVVAPEAPQSTQTVVWPPQAAAPTTEPSIPTEAAPTILNRLMRPIHIFLNEKPMTLPAKENGQPYYLMDLLERSELDFDNLDRPVYLAINGLESGFREVVRDRDHVTIRCV